MLSQLSSGLQNQNQHPQFITVNELSALLKIPKKTLYNWVSRKEIPYIKIGGHLRFVTHEVISHFSGKVEAFQQPCVHHPPQVKRGLSWSLKSREANRCQLFHKE